jgi:hypothetical protein
MSAPLNKRLLLSLASGGLLFTPVAAHEPPTPLLQTLEKLACAADARTAQQKLDTLFNISPPGQDWPDEWLGKQPDHASLYAGTLDIALQTLLTTAKRFPELRETSERVALQWNYCDVLDDQQFYDLSLQRSELKKVLADNDVPLKWQGFRQWGFLTPDPPDRFVPRLLDEIRLAPSAYHLFLHQVYRQHCFPHPETGMLVSEAEAPRDTVEGHTFPLLVEENAQPQPYPFEWNPVCTAPKPAVATQTQTAQIVEQLPPQTGLKTQTAATVVATHSEKKAAKKTLLVQPVTNRQRVVTPVIPAPSQSPPVVEEVAATPVVPASPTNAPPFSIPPQEGENGAKGNQGKALTSAKREEGQVVLPAIVPIAAGGDIPMYIEEEESATQQAHSTTGIIDRKKKKLRLAGSFADTLSLKDGSNGLSASATWSPKPNWFISGNTSFKDGKVGYSWSVGYADNKPGGWSAQVNNWGPLKPGDGLALDKAVVNIGKKINSETLAKHKLAASSNLSIPVKGKPGLSGTLQWNPKPNWYARTTASLPLEGGKPNWNYAFGYSNPKPGKWRVEYSNYGKNNFPGDNLKDGAITVSRGWQF